MTAVTEQMDNPQRGLENIRVERAPAHVTTTVGDTVLSGINTVESGIEQPDTEWHRNESNVVMVLTLSQSAERDNEVQQEQTWNLDPREQLQVINGVKYASLVSFDDFPSEDYRRMATLLWFSHWAVLADDESGFTVLEHYAWDGEFFWGVIVDALSPRVWRDVIVVDEADLSFRCLIDMKRVRQVGEVFKGFRVFPMHRSFKETCMSTYGGIERTADVRTLQICALCRQSVWKRGEAGTSFMRTQYVGNEPFLFRTFVMKTGAHHHNGIKVKSERRTLLALGRFMRYHRLCCYNLTETAHDRVSVGISAIFAHLEVCHGFNCEQEPIFSYKLRVLIEDRESGLWVVAYTEHVLRVCVALLMAVYSDYRLWYVPLTL